MTIKGPLLHSPQGAFHLGHPCGSITNALPIMFRNLGGRRSQASRVCRGSRVGSHLGRRHGPPLYPVGTTTGEEVRLPLARSAGNRSSGSLITPDGNSKVSGLPWVRRIPTGGLGVRPIALPATPKVRSINPSDIRKSGR